MRQNTQLVNIWLSPEMVERIEQYWHEHRFRSRSEGIRALLATALNVEASRPSAPEHAGYDPAKDEHIS